MRAAHAFSRSFWRSACARMRTRADAALERPAIMAASRGSSPTQPVFRSLERPLARSAGLLLARAAHPPARALAARGRAPCQRPEQSASDAGPACSAGSRAAGRDAIGDSIESRAAPQREIRSLSERACGRILWYRAALGRGVCRAEGYVERLEKALRRVL